MNEQQTKCVQEAVDLLFKDSYVSRLVKPAYFPSLVDEVRNHLQAGSEKALPNEIELYCVTALCVLGPGGRGIPPKDMRKQLIRIVNKYGKDHPERTLEFAVAFGCGKWREAEPRDQGWPGQWPRAIDVMSLAMVHAIREASIWLSNNLPGYHKPEFWWSDEGREIISMDATYLALQLINPLRSLHLEHNEDMQIQCLQDGAVYRMQGQIDNEEIIPAGARLVFSFPTGAELIKQEKFETKERRALEPGTSINILIRDAEIRIEFSPKMRRVTLKPGTHALIPGPVNFDGWTCSCGNKNCAQRHRLDGWDPTGRVTLWSFLASAVKGIKKLKTKSFADASYYPLLAMAGGASGARVRMAPVVMWTCPNPACSSSDGAKHFEDERCPSCKKPFDPGKAKAIKQNLLIAVSEQGVYVPIKMRHCNASSDAKGQKIICDNYYIYSDDPKCPLCGHSPKVKRATHLWIRNFNAQISPYNDQSAIDNYSTGEEPSILLEGVEEVAIKLVAQHDKESELLQKPQARGEKSENADD